MKKIFIVLAILFTTVITNAQFSSASLTAAGLTCAMCTKAIYSSLEKIPAVEKVEADIKSSLFNITFKKGVAIDPDQIKDVVEEAGFSVSSLKMTGDFNNIDVSNDSHVEIGGKNYHFLKASGKVLNGLQTIAIVDKNYVSPKEFKKVAGLTEHPCVETGKAEECCVKSGTKHNERIYHVML